MPIAAPGAQGSYALPKARARFALTPFRRAILALNPTHFYPCDDAYTKATDYGSVPQNLDAGNGTFGNGPILTGEQHSVGVAGTGIHTTAAFSFPAQFTYGVFVVVYAIASENVYAGSWNGAGTMIFAASSALRAYMGGSFISSGVSMTTGRHFLAATYDGTSLSLYLDGVLVAGPTALGFSGSSDFLWINGYSATAKGGVFQASDLFVTASAVAAEMIAHLYKMSRG